MRLDALFPKVSPRSVLDFLRQSSRHLLLVTILNSPKPLIRTRDGMCRRLIVVHEFGCRQRTRTKNLRCLFRYLFPIEIQDSLRTHGDERKGDVEVEQSGWGVECVGLKGRNDYQRHGPRPDLVPLFFFSFYVKGWNS